MEDETKTADIRVGCCGFPVSRKRYYRTFRVVEVQQTFYQPPALATATRWRGEAPPNFEFTVKAWQLITHEPSSPTYRRLKTEIPADRRDRYGSFRPTGEVMDAWKQTRTVAKTLAASAVAFQCPASFRPTRGNLHNMRTFFRGIKEREFTFVWEP